jgi:hypothetical protein
MANKRLRLIDQWRKAAEATTNVVTETGNGTMDASSKGCGQFVVTHANTDHDVTDIRYYIVG